MKMLSMAAAAVWGFSAGAALAGTVSLADGTVIQGDIVDRKDSLITIESKSLGRITLPAKEVTWIGTSNGGRSGLENKSENASANAFANTSETGSTETAEGSKPSDGSPIREPSDQALFFMPTAFTPPAKSFSFRDFELLFITMGYSPTDMTSISGGFLFPVSPDLQLLTAGIKQRLWEDPDGTTALAVTGNITKPLGDLSDDNSFFVNANLVAGKRNETGSGIHAAIGYLGAKTLKDDIGGDKTYDWHGSFTYALGAEGRLTPHVKFIAEYLSAVPFGEGANIGGGLLTMGLRLHGDRLSADIAGTRPITDSDLGSFFMWPMLVVSYRY